MAAEITRIRQRRAARLDQLELFLETAADLLGAGILNADALSHLTAAAAERRAQITEGKGFVFVQLNPERMAEVMQALQDLTGARPMEAMRVLHAVLAAAGWDDQWCAKTQQEIADDLKMNAASISRAFKALAAPSVRALVNKERRGHSWRYEIDANLASRLSNTARTAAAARQSRAAGTTLSVVDNGAA